jgi:hypothetical protein
MGNSELAGVHRHSSGRIFFARATEFPVDNISLEEDF